ncbi:hypothetical protein BZB76_2198 [Actinomadura pelletieri DSM 43383]|uniref:Ribbon-helix-helix CopG family protein n=1 Tax=Actinomadura pelletieri DSM 43383 TaxID=1120940 RepID=A0A495QTI6_9ACTN|nr:hypothetical protein [Actinomadura pelletieri]RKS76832.1 hypothetical protein BZB76_2198 [Actinomadura pelletieri DSM 43383]
MNVELPRTLRDDLTAVAADEGLPPEEALTRAVTDWIRRRREHRARVHTLIQEIMDEDATLLARLGDA